MTPLERLLLEAIPDGTFGGARDRRAARGRERELPATPPHIAAQHRAELEAALDAHRAHLTPVPTHPEGAQAA